LAASGSRGRTSQFGDVRWQIYQSLKPLQMAGKTYRLVQCMRHWFLFQILRQKYIRQRCKRAIKAHQPSEHGVGIDRQFPTNFKDSRR
jgi:hypothetical protein